MGSLRKYFGEQGNGQATGQGGQHPGRLFWPGTLEGYPVLAENAGHVRQEEIENVELQSTFYSGWFNLVDEAQKAKFDQVMDRISNNWYVLKNRKDHYDEKTGHYRVWLEWCQIYGRLPHQAELTDD